jgi:hypothetical protein
LSLESLDKYISQLLPLITRHTNVRIGGGEPVLHPQIFEMLQLLIEKVRPKLEIPLVLLSNGVGDRVNQILDEIRKRYDTFDSPYISTKANLILQSTKQICINASKSHGAEQYVKARHKPIFRAPVDLLPPQGDWARNCPQKNGCNITPHGVFVCCGSSRIISTLFRLRPGEGHILSEEEEETQRQKFCKYCSYLCQPLVPSEEPSEAYKEAIENWRANPYYLEEVEPDKP